MDMYIVPIVMVIFTAIYFAVESKIVKAEGENEMTWIRVKIAFAYVVILVTIINTIGAGKYDIFPNVIILIASLTIISDNKRELKRKKVSDCTMPTEILPVTFCKLCCDDENIKDFIDELSREQRIKLRADLKQKIVNKDKYTIVIFMCTFFGTLFAVENGEQILPAGLFLFVLSVVLCCLTLYNKSRYTKSLSFLDDYDTYKN